MMPFHSCSVPGRKPGTSTNVSTGTLNASQVRTNRAAFSAALMSSVPARCRGWFATTPTARPVDPAEPGDHVGRVELVHRQEHPVVEHGVHHVGHVVRLVGRVGDQRVQREIGVGELDVGRRHGSSGGRERLFDGR